MHKKIWRLTLLFLFCFTIFLNGSLSGSSFSLHPEMKPIAPTSLDTPQGMISQTSEHLTTLSSELNLLHLLLYITTSLDQNDHSFDDIPSRDFRPADFNTTITNVHALTVLKITGLHKYTISTINQEEEIFNSLGPSINGGYKIHYLAQEPSVVGTYGVVLSAQLLDRVLFLKSNQDELINFILNRYINTGSNIGGFTESYELAGDASISTTYSAIHALSILEYNFNTSLRNEITNLLIRAWNNGNNQYFKDPVENTSAILNSFQAISILSFLNQTGSINSSLYNEILNSYPTWLSSQQMSSGPLLGGFQSNNNVANIIDTGSALSALYLLDRLSIVNLTAATSFIISSQYLPDINLLTEIRGGFSSNNLTQNDVFIDVRMKFTYYAILGLYASGYITNNTEISFKTGYSSQSSNNTLSNEILVGELDELNFKIVLLGFRSYNNLTLNINSFDWDVAQNRTELLIDNNGYEFIYKMQNNTKFNWTLGEHILDGTYYLYNFTVLDPYITNFSKSINVRLPFSSKLNSSFNQIEISPGDFLQGEVIFDNDSVVATGLSFNQLGNITVELIYPNGTAQVVNNSFQLNITNQNYSFNITITNWAPMGDYFVNLTYTNNTAIIAFSQQKMELRTQIQLFDVANKDANSALVIYPGQSYDLNITASYSNGFMANSTRAYAHFVQEDSPDDVIFSALLTQIINATFQIDESITVPNRLLMGEYKIILEFVWNSTITNSSFNVTAMNMDLPIIDMGGVPVVVNPLFDPVRQRTVSEIFYGDFLNLSATIAIGGIPNSPIVPLEENITLQMQGLIVLSSSNETHQILSFKQLTGPQISMFGEINPNFVRGTNFFLRLQVLLESTSKFVDIYQDNNASAFYQPEFIHNATNLLQIRDEDIIFLSETQTVNFGRASSLLINFKVISTEFNNFVSKLNLKANTTDSPKIQLSGIFALEAGNSYQLQIFIPSDLEVGEYIVKILTESAVSPDTEIGKILFEIIPEVINEDPIPIENIVAIGTLVIALVTIYISLRIQNSRKNQ